MHSNDIRDLVLDVIWTQWRALGVPAATERSLLLVDLEALIVETAWRTRDGESRIRDGAISWLVEFPHLVTTVRLRGFDRRAGEQLSEQVRLLARQVADNGVRVSWPMADDAPRWTPAANIHLPFLPDRPELLRVRMRSMFGANARAEVTSLLTTFDSPVPIPVIVQRTGYSRRQVVEALNGLELAGWILRTTVGSSSRYALAGAALAMLGFDLRDVKIGPREFDVVRQSTTPAWLDWFERFELLRLLEHAATLVERADTIAALLELRRADRAFASQGIPVPDTTGSHEGADQLAERVADWISGTALRLAGRAIVL